MTRVCIECEHCDLNKTTDIKQVWCEKFSTYVSCYSDCDYFTNPTYDSFMSDLYKELEREQSKVK